MVEDQTFPCLTKNRCFSVSPSVKHLDIYIVVHGGERKAIDCRHEKQGCYGLNTFRV